MLNIYYFARLKNEIYIYMYPLYRFPFNDRKVLKYWIAATGRNNWFPPSHARICGLHFCDIDYFYSLEYVRRKQLRPNVIPTQYVDVNIVEVFRQDKINIVKKRK